MGAIYMILGLAVMVPMAFLTEELMGYLSTTSQQGERQLQAGVALAAVAELEKRGLFASASSGRDPAQLTNDPQAVCRQAVGSRGVTELLENDDRRSRNPADPIPSVDGSVNRFVIVPWLSEAAGQGFQSAGFMLKLEAVQPVDLTQANMLPALASDAEAGCASYRAFTYKALELCPVSDVNALRWRTESDGWRWRWPRPPELVRVADELDCPQGLFLYKT